MSRLEPAESGRAAPREPLLTLVLTGIEAPTGAAGAAVYEVAVDVGVEPRRAGRLRVMIEELVREAQEREHGDDDPTVEVRASVDADRLVIEVNDRGIPVDEREIVAIELPHELVRLGFVEKFGVSAHGKLGNVATCSLPISGDDVRDGLGPEHVLAADAQEIDDHDLEVRRMRADECGQLARLVYRCYGYSYPAEDVYFPERMAALVDAGLMHSVVTVTAAGEVVGHAAATLDRVGARVAEAGKLVVDPRYRSHGLARRMADLRLDTARDLDLLGLWTECVSNHQYSQRNQLKLGAVETGVILGFVPPETSMTALDGDDSESDSQRGSLVAMYRPIPGGPRRTMHVPERYRAVVRDIVTAVGLEREITGGARPSDGASIIDVAVHQDSGSAFITARRIGPDLLDHLEQRLEELLRIHIAVVYLDLPTADPGTAHCGDHISGLGFFFSALLPEAAEEGDHLRLQLLNAEEIDSAEIHTASDWGESLLERVMADKERVDEHVRSLRLSG